MTDTLFRLAVVSREPIERVRQARDRLAAAIAEQPRVAVDWYDSPDDLPSDGLAANLVVVLGGDGTILRTCRQLGAFQCPMVGVNLGRLGFLADLTEEGFVSQLGRFVGGEYHVVRHLMFECRLERADGTTETHLGLNEAAVLSGGAFSMLHVNLAVDAEPVATYGCDGLILSTPVGSTAHNLAAGGPILRQDLQAFVITPICAHTLTQRPVVDRADCVYTLSLDEPPPGTTLVIDGQVKLPLLPGDRVVVSRAPVSFLLARLPEHSYYATLHRKLGWGGNLVSNNGPTNGHA
ncbi:MAG: NAD(+)/NADH kinase [Planctomycetaceae bacterium]|nr:NAD(+)/NADH kinase [Planctomycetaceae bacterium]